MRDLFKPEEQTQLSEYTAAYAAWQKGARRRGEVTGEQALAVYEDMWVVFARWASTKGRVLAIEHITADQLSDFIASRVSLSPRYVWRFLHLIDRVLAHWALQRGRAANPAPMELLESRNDWLYANVKREDATDHLTPAQASQLVTHLSKARPRPGRAGRGANAWQELRNNALIGLQLGAGLSPGEVRELPLTSPVFEQGRQGAAPRKIRVPAIGVAASRESPVAPWAGRLLSHWLQVRSELAIPGVWLFPSTKTGKQMGKPAQYLVTCNVLTAAGWSEDQVKGGSFRLRHTFALRQLRRGVREEDVARWLGLADTAPMARYREILKPQ